MTLFDDSSEKGNLFERNLWNTFVSLTQALEKRFHDNFLKAWDEMKTALTAACGNNRACKVEINDAYFNRTPEYNYSKKY